MLGQCLIDISTSYGLPLSLFLGGLVGGFTHCTWMCGSFVLVQTDGSMGYRKLNANLLLPYHIGRMTTYVTLAVLVGSVVNLSFLFSDFKAIISAPLLISAGIIFLITAFPQLSSIFPWAQKLRIGVSYAWISGLVSRLMKHQNFISRYGLGVLLGFMPCGLVVAALMASASAPDALASGVAMAAFTIGTVPALLMVSIGGLGFNSKYPKAYAYIKRGGLVLSSLWLFVLAGAMVF